MIFQGQQLHDEFYYSFSWTSIVSSILPGVCAGIVISMDHRSDFSFRMSFMVIVLECDFLADLFPQHNSELDLL